MTVERSNKIAHTLKYMKIRKVMTVAILVVSVFIALFFSVRSAFPRPYRAEIRASGLDPSLVYAVIKTESGFDERAVSRSGAVGLMQLMPATAKFICAREKIVYEEEKLTMGAYNLKLGLLYLKYLSERFPAEETALAAYNAGEGTVREWLENTAFSEDGLTLKKIPYPETARYLKKIGKIKKFYDFFY